MASAHASCPPHTGTRRGGFCKFARPQRHAGAVTVAAICHNAPRRRGLAARAYLVVPNGNRSDPARVVIR